ncbi:hypothetical protein FACS189485_05420 [Spirochaetia bacterium]|nr:hypothetical protein FACS189485_05420 [Spirochaetia bacterium]
MSLKSTIVDAYSVILEIALWLIIILCAAAGYYIENEVIYHDGWFWGVVLGALGGFIIDALFFGTLALILDIRNTLKEIAGKMH